jgi:hypothetical protein
MLGAPNGRVEMMLCWGKAGAGLPHSKETQEAQAESRCYLESRCLAASAMIFSISSGERGSRWLKSS